MIIFLLLLTLYNTKVSKVCQQPVLAAKLKLNYLITNKVTYLIAKLII